MSKWFLATFLACVQVWASAAQATAPKAAYTDFKRHTKVWKFDLTDADGKAFDNDTLSGKWTVLGFGFTKCPDLCPMMMTDLKRELKSLPKALKKKLQIYFVTLDPKYDTAQRLKDYLKAYDLGYPVKAVTGDQKKLHKFARNFAPPQYQTPASESADSTRLPEILHSGSFFVVNPKGELAGIFSQPMRPRNQMFKELAALKE